MAPGQVSGNTELQLCTLAALAEAESAFPLEDVRDGRRVGQGGLAGETQDVIEGMKAVFCVSCLGSLEPRLQPVGKDGTLGCQKCICYICARSAND